MSKSPSDINVRAADMWSYAVLLWELATRQESNFDLQVLLFGAQNDNLDAKNKRKKTIRSGGNQFWAQTIEQTLGSSTRSCFPNTIYSLITFFFFCSIFLIFRAYCQSYFSFASNIFLQGGAFRRPESHGSWHEGWSPTDNE